MTFRDQLKRLLSPIYTRINSMVARAILEEIDDSGDMQLAKVSLLAGEVKSGLEYPGVYGITGKPSPGAEAIVLFIGGRRDQGLVVSLGQSSERVKPEFEGETVLYNEHGTTIKLKQNNVLEINADNVNINLGAGGKLKVNESLEVDA